MTRTLQSWRRPIPVVAALLLAVLSSAWAVDPPADSGISLSTAPAEPTPLGCRTTRSELTCSPRVDTSGLAPLGNAEQATNPYRGNETARATGQALFNQTCAFCHGKDADGSRVAAADLRRLDTHCRRIRDTATRAWCERDVDAYFINTVRIGRRTLDIVHMPSWAAVLSQEQIWAIKTFIESKAL